MSVSYSEIESLLQSNPKIREIYIQEGAYLWVAILTRLEEPNVRNGELIEEALINNPLHEFGTINREDIIAIIRSFESFTREILVPSPDSGLLTFNHDDYTLIITSPPMSFQLGITIRLKKKQFDMETVTA